MKTLASMAPERLAELIGRFRSLEIAVLGDFFLDKYLDVDPSLAEVSVETGKTAHQVVAIRRSPGAAGTVVCNLAALGAGRIQTIGFTGDDGEAYELRRELAALGCCDEHLHCDPTRLTPTYLKPRRPWRSQSGRRAQPLRHQEPHDYARRDRSPNPPLARHLVAPRGRRDCPGPGCRARLRRGHWPSDRRSGGVRCGVPAGRVLGRQPAANSAASAARSSSPTSSRRSAAPIPCRATRCRWRSWRGRCRT